MQGGAKNTSAVRRMARERSLGRVSEADGALWARYLAEVKPLPGRRRPAVAAEEPTAPPPPSDPPEPTPWSRRSRVLAPVAVGRQPAGMDSATWRRLETGRYPPTRQLDLHGHTVERAFRAVDRFLEAARRDRLRCVEIVTGRGRGGEGVIGRELPFWLNRPEMRPFVLAVSYAHPGNTGAIRVLLRRARDR